MNDLIVGAAALGFVLWVILAAASVPHSWWVFGVALALLAFVIVRRMDQKDRERVLGIAGGLGHHSLIFFAPIALIKGEYKIAGVLAATGIVLFGTALLFYRESEHEEEQTDGGGDGVGGVVDTVVDGTVGMDDPFDLDF